MPPRSPAPPSDDVPKGAIEMLVLKTLTIEPMHGYAIVRHIEQTSNGVFVIEHGSLYPALERLQANGYIVGRWTESPTGRRARIYTITAAGRKRLGDRLSAFDRVQAALNAVLKAT